MQENRAFSKKAPIIQIVEKRTAAVSRKETLEKKTGVLVLKQEDHELMSKLKK